MRRLIQPLMAIFELLHLGASWIVAFIHPPTAQRMVDWAMRTLPDAAWYRG